MHKILAQIAFGCVGLVETAAAQMLWTQVASAGPAARSNHAMTQDVARGRTVLFGGLSIASPIGNFTFADTWEWDGTTWVQVATGLPQTRTYHAMVYDSRRSRTVMFGGNNFGADYGDTWEWDGTAWTRRSNAGPPRHWHGMAYDSQRARIVMFGGAGSYGSAWFDDTWEWDGATWTQVATTGPGTRIQPAMAYDARRGRTVLFGGRSPTGELGDTWEWDGNSWIQMATTGPTVRSGPAMTYDSLRDRTVLFGGLRYPFCFADTWEWDGTAWTWVAGGVPSGRAGPAMVHDPAAGKIVLFGGFVTTTGNPIYLAETWERSLWSTATTYGTGCGNPPLVLSPLATARPTIHSSAVVELSNIPSPAAFVSLGWSRANAGTQPLPVPLAYFGMPGCSLLQSAEANAEPVTFTGPATGTYSLTVPNWPGLIGLKIYLQGWADAPGANPGGLVVSNGIEWVIGGS